MAASKASGRVKFDAAFKSWRQRSALSRRLPSEIASPLPRRLLLDFDPDLYSFTRTCPSTSAASCTLCSASTWYRSLSTGVKPRGGKAPDVAGMGAMVCASVRRCGCATDDDVDKELVGESFCDEICMTAMMARTYFAHMSADRKHVAGSALGSALSTKRRAQVPPEAEGTGHQPQRWGTSSR